MGSCEQDSYKNQELEDSGCVHDDSPKKDIETQAEAEMKNKVENVKNDMENTTDNVKNTENTPENVENMTNTTENVNNIENTMEDTTENVENMKNDEENDYDRQPNLLDLSDDVLLCILKYLSPQDLKALGYSCARLGSLVLERSLWNQVDARGTPYGKLRMRWLLQAVHSGTTEFMVTGLASLTNGCMGHVNRTRKEVEDEEEALRPKAEPTDEADDRHRQLYEQAVANLPEEDRQELNNQAPVEEPQPRFNPLVRQHARLHIHPQPMLDLPRISTYPSWPDECELTTEPADDKQAVNSHTGGCPGPQFTMSSHTLALLRELCPRLTTLYMEYCNIDCKKTSIAHFPNTIKRLSLRGTRCYNLPMDKSFLFKIHDHLPKIEYFDLSECEWLEPASLLPLSKIPRLQTLLLRDCVGMTEFVAYVSLATRYGFRQLKMLDFRGCPVGDSEVSALGWLPALVELHLSPPRAAARAHHHHYRHEPLPRHAHLDTWEMQEPDYYNQSQHDSTISPQTSVDDTAEEVEQIRDIFARNFEHDMISIEVHARYPQRNENDDHLRNRRPNPGDQAGPSALRLNISPDGPRPGPNDDAGPSKRSKRDNSDNDSGNDYGRSVAGPSRRRRIRRYSDVMPGSNLMPSGSMLFRDSLNDSNNNERFNNNNEPGPSRNNKRVQNDSSNNDSGNVSEASDAGPSKRVRMDGNNIGGGNSEGGPPKKPKKDDKDDAKKQSKKCDKGKYKGGKNTRSGHEAEAPIANNDDGDRGNNNNDNDYVSLSSHVQFNRNERAIYINMGETTSGVATSIKIQSEALGCMYENVNEEKVTAEKSTNTENSSAEGSKDKEGSKEGGTNNGDKNNETGADSNTVGNNGESQRPASPQPGPSKAKDPQPSGSKYNDKDKSPNQPPNDNPRITNVSNVEVIIVQHNQPDDDIDNLGRLREPMMHPEEDSQGSQDFGGVETVRRDVEVIIMDHNADVEAEVKMDDGQEVDDFAENDEEIMGGERIDELGNIETAERNNERTDDDDTVNNEDNNSTADNSSTNAVTIGDGSRSGSSQSTSTSSSLSSSHSYQSASSSQTSSSSSKGSTSCTSSSSSEVSSRSSSNEELRNEEPRNEERAGSYVRFRRVRAEPPIVVQHFPDHVEPRHHVLYVNLGQQLHAVYRLLPGRPFFHPRSLQRTLSTQRLEFSSLVTDSAIRRFGRAEGEDVNIIIGPNGPQFGGRDMGGRPNRSNLRILSATGYRQITNRSLIHLATSAPHLEQIDFSNTGVTAEGVENFRSIRPDCEVKFSKFKNEEEEQ